MPIAEENLLTNASEILIPPTSRGSAACVLVVRNGYGLPTNCYFGRALL